MTYLETCQAQVKELNELVDNFHTIVARESVDIDHRYRLVMAPACLGRIKELFEALSNPLELEVYEPRILGYQSCINLTESEISCQLKSLNGLLTSTDE